MMHLRLGFIKARSSILVSNKPLQRSLQIFHLSTRTSLRTEQDSSTVGKMKPNLRRAAKNNKPRNIAVLACILMTIYMYPMIFRPLFGIGQSSDDNSKKLEDLRNELAKHRPDFMPEWSSPFGPKTEG